MLLDQDQGGDPFRTMARKAHSAEEAVPFRFGQQLTGWMLKNRKPLLINDLTLDEVDPFSKQPDYKKCAVKVTKLETTQ